MIPATCWAGIRVLVFGLGVSGLACVRSLLAGGADVIVSDDDIPAAKSAMNTLGEAFRVCEPRDVNWSGIKALILSPGVALTHPKPHSVVELAHRHSVPVIGDMELFAREIRSFRSPVTVVAITGTNGKSTTAALTHHVLCSLGYETVLGGNIGRAVMDLPPLKSGCVHVLEVSSYQIELAPSFQPDVGILLNISPDHLDRHGTIHRYVSIKASMLARSADVVIGEHDARSRRIARELENSGISVLRLREGADAVGRLRFFGSNPRIQMASTVRPVDVHVKRNRQLRGGHNGQNAAAAIAVATLLEPLEQNAGGGLFSDRLQAALESFAGLPHRMETVGQVQGVEFVNDSKATNADSAIRALGSFSDIFWIVGGRAKSRDRVLKVSDVVNVRGVYLIGENAGAFIGVFSKLFANCDHDIPIRSCGQLDAAIKSAFQDAHAQLEAGNAQNPTVLLSPACASFDQFRSFSHRGEEFCEQVKVMPGFTSFSAEFCQ